MAIKILARLVSIVTWLLDLVWGFFMRRAYGVHSVSPIKSPLLLCSASRLAEKIRNGEVTSTKLVQTYIDRIKEVNPVINALTSDCFATALREAAEVDERIAELRKGGREDELKTLFAKRPFLGVPISIKHTYAMRGELWTGGVYALRSSRATRDSHEVRRCREAGMIVTCATNMSELGMWMESSNPVFGRTLNPYNVSRCVGGSSGGEGALIAAAGSVFGLGSDIGGSVRIPSAFNGIFGHKPSRNLGYDTDGHRPPALSERQRNMLVYGPMCRYSSDLWPLLMTMLGDEGRAKISARKPSDVNLKRIKFLYFDTVVPLRPRVAKGPFSLDGFVNQLDEPVSSALASVVRFVRDELQADISELELEPEMQAIRIPRMFEIWGANMMSPDNSDEAPDQWKMRNGRPWSEASSLHAMIDNNGMLEDDGTDKSNGNSSQNKAHTSKSNSRLHEYKEILGAMLKRILGDKTRSVPILGLALVEAIYVDVDGHRTVHRLLSASKRYEEAFYSMFERYKRSHDGVIILCPVLPNVAPYHNRMLLSSPGDAIHTAMYNLIGLPATVAPILKDSKTNLPACVQIVSALHDDAISIAFAERLETKFGGWRAPWRAN